MKSCAPCAPVSPFASPPARGAWIEIAVVAFSYAMSLSPPARGAWIEIGAIILYSSSRYVAPRTGGVD